MRSAHWLCLIVVVVSAWTISACGDASSPQLGGYDEGDPGSSGGNAGSQSGGGGSSTSGGSDGGASKGDAGSGGGGGSDAGSGGGSDSGSTAPTDAFSGADPYVAMLGASTLKSGHQSQLGTQNPAGHNCLQCHGFAFAGTVYSTGTTPVAKAEVRVIDGMGAARSTYTDANGNFFFAGSSGFTAPAMVGVRDATNTQLMVGKISDGGCNTCHDGSGTARIHLP